MNFIVFLGYCICNWVAYATVLHMQLSCICNWVAYATELHMPLYCICNRLHMLLSCICNRLHMQTDCRQQWFPHIYWVRGGIGGLAFGQGMGWEGRWYVCGCWGWWGDFRARCGWGWCCLRQQCSAFARWVGRGVGRGGRCGFRARGVFFGEAGAENGHGVVVGRRRLVHAVWWLWGVWWHSRGSYRHLLVFFLKKKNGQYLCPYTLRDCARKWEGDDVTIKSQFFTNGVTKNHQCHITPKRISSVIYHLSVYKNSVI